VEGQPSVVELPMTAAHRAAVHRATALKRKVYLSIFTFFALLGPSLSVWFGRQVEVLFFAAGVAGLAVVADRRYWQGPARRDLQRGTYRRASGPIDVTVGRSRCDIRIGETRLRVSDLDVASELRTLPWGSLDYAPDSRVIFEQHAEHGELVVRSPHYRPDEPADAAVNERVLPVLAWVAAITATLLLGLTSALFVFGNVSAGDELRSVAFSPDGALVAAGTGGGVVQTWRVVGGAPGARFTIARPATWPFTRERSDVDALAFDESGQSVAVVAGPGLSTWHPGDRAPLSFVALSRPAVGSFWRHGAAVSPDGTLAVLGTGDATIEAVRLADGSRAWSRPSAYYLNAVAWLAGSPSWVAVALRNGIVLVLRADDGQLVRELDNRSTTRSRRSDDGVQGLAFSPDGTTLAAAADDGTIRLWSMTDGAQRLLAQPGPEQTAIAWSPDGQLIASAITRGNLVRVWRATDGVQLYAAGGHRHWVAALAFSPDSTLLASASRDGTVRLIRAADGAPRAMLRLTD